MHSITVSLHNSFIIHKLKKMLNRIDAHFIDINQPLCTIHELSIYDLLIILNELIIIDDNKTYLELYKSYKFASSLCIIIEQFL